MILFGKKVFPMLYLQGSGTAYKEGLKIKDRLDAMTPLTSAQAFVGG